METNNKIAEKLEAIKNNCDDISELLRSNQVSTSSTVVDFKDDSDVNEDSDVDDESEDMYGLAFQNDEERTLASNAAQPETNADKNKKEPYWFPTNKVSPLTETTADKNKKEEPYWFPTNKVSPTTENTNFDELDKMISTKPRTKTEAEIPRNKVSPTTENPQFDELDQMIPTYSKSKPSATPFSNRQTKKGNQVHIINGDDELKSNQSASSNLFNNIFSRNSTRKGGRNRKIKSLKRKKQIKKGKKQTHKK